MFNVILFFSFKFCITIVSRGNFSCFFKHEMFILI